MILVMLVSILTLLTIWLLMRQIVLWYLKLNRIVAILESIDLSLSLLPGVRDERVRMNKIPKRAA